MSGDIGIRFGYVDDPEGGKEPALGLYPTRVGEINMYAIPLSAAYKYTDEKYLLTAAFNMAVFFNMHPDRFIVNRIADLILNYLPDLIKMRPAGPEELGEINGEGVVSLNGEKMAFATTTNGGVIH